MGRWVVPFFVRVGRSDGDATAGPGGWLRVEPDQLDGAIAVFQDALHILEREVGEAMYAIEARPPAADAVSREAVEVFNQRGYRSADSAVAAWRGAVGELRRIVEQLTAAKRAVMAADAGNAASFRPAL
jgi:hypothetical protein